MEWWHKAGVLAGIATIATVLLAKKRRISKTYVYGPFSDYEEAMAVHESVKAEYEVAAEIGNLELKELTLPALRGGPTGMKGGYAFTITVLGFPPTLAAEDVVAIDVGRDNQLFEWLQKQSVFYCDRCKASSEDEELRRVITDDYHFIIYCEECESKIWNQMRAEGYEVSFNTLPGALDFFPTSTGRPPDNYLDVEKEYEAEEMGRTEVATALLHKAKNWPFIQSFDYEHWTQSPEEMIQLGHPIKILNSWDDLEQSDIGNHYAWFYINFPLTVYRGSLKRPKKGSYRDADDKLVKFQGIDYEGYLEHEYFQASKYHTMGYTNVIATSPYLSEALSYARLDYDFTEEGEGGNEPSELYSFDIQDYVVTFPRGSFTVRGHEDKPVVMVAGGILHDDATLLWNTDEDSSWYDAEEVGRTEVATALLHKAKNWPFIQSFDYHEPVVAMRSKIESTLKDLRASPKDGSIKILNSWDDLDPSDIGDEAPWFYINFPLTVYRGNSSYSTGKEGINYEGYLEHEYITANPTNWYGTAGRENVISTSPHIAQAMTYGGWTPTLGEYTLPNVLSSEEWRSELYSFDIQDYVVTFPRASLQRNAGKSPLYDSFDYDKPVVMVAGGIWLEDTILLWETEGDSSWYGAEDEEEDTYAHALAEMKKYLMMTLGVTIPGIGAKQRDAARDFWEWFENKAETYHTMEVGDYECTYYTPEVKQCFYNAFMTLSEIEDAKYYEGWAVTLSGISIPIEHAWLVTKEGRVIDTTFALLEREYGHDKSEVVYMGVEIPYSYLLNAVVESGRAGPFLRNYWADDTDSGIEHEYRLYFAEGEPDYYSNPKRGYTDPALPWGRSPWERQNPKKPDERDWDTIVSSGKEEWERTYRNKKPEIKPEQHVRLINYPLFSAQQGRDLRKVEARAQAKRKQIKDMYESYDPQMPRGYGERDIGDYFSK